MTDRKFKFVSRIKGARDVHERTASEFAKLVREKRETPGFTLQEYLKPEKGMRMDVRPFYDWDAKYEETPKDLDAEKKKQSRDFAETVSQLHPGARVLYAQRHGHLDNGGKYTYKISYRAFLPDLVMKITDIPLHVRRVLGLGPKETHAHLDLSVYKDKEQLLGVIYGTKDIDKVKRYLIPLGGPEGPPLRVDDVDPGDYLVQNVSKDAAVVVVPTAAKGKSRPKKEATGGKGEDTAGAAGSNGSRRLTRSDFPEAMDAAGDFFGERYRLQEVFTYVIVDPAAGSLTFPTMKKWCFIRKGSHGSNNPYVTVTERGARYKCPDEECKTKGDQPHIPLQQLPQSIRDLFHSQIIAQSEDQTAIREAKEECKTSIVDNFRRYDRNALSPWKCAGEEDGRGPRFVTELPLETCQWCKEDATVAEHTLGGLRLRCTRCGKEWPTTGPIPAEQKDHPKLFAVLTQLNVQQNLSVVVNNNYAAPSDDPIPLSAYEEDGLRILEDDTLNACFIRALQGTDASLSELVFHLFKDTFHCAKAGAKGTEGMWFQYMDHHWVDKAELDLKNFLGSEDKFLKHFRRALQFYERDSVQTEDTKKKARAIRRIIEQIGDGYRRKRILDDAIIQFHRHRPAFMERLDTADKLVFTNGVLDLKTFDFTEGRPEDLLSIQLSFPYQPLDMQSAECAYVMEFMTAIQPDIETRDYLLTVLSLCLSTDTSMQYFWVFTGAGANGKSKLVNFLSEALGEHFGTAPAALLTRKREDANQANEALSSLQKARVAVFSEGASTEVIQVNVMKLFTGEDTISARGIHEKQKKWKPFFTCIIVCNDIPTLDENTWAAWRRLKVVFFPTCFVDQPVRPHERQKDPKLGEKLSRCTGALLSILTEYLRRFKATSILQDPPAVKAATEKYRESMDVVKDFIEEKMRRSEGSYLLWTDLFAAYNKWPLKKAMKSQPLKEAFAKHDVKYQITTFEGRPFVGVKGWELL